MQALGETRETCRWNSTREIQNPFRSSTLALFPRPVYPFLPLSFIYSLSAELRKSENRPEPGHDCYFPARELHHYNSPHSSPPRKRTSQSRGGLMPGPPELCLAPVHGRCLLVRPGKNICVGWEPSSTRLKSGSPSIY